MNKQVHRLVFDRKRGMRVPAAEHVRAASKAGSGQTSKRRAAVLLCLAGVAGTLIEDADAAGRSLGAVLPRAAARWAGRTNAGLPNGRANLPVVSEQYRGDDDTDEVRKLTYGENSLRVDQFKQRAIFNWDSFNIGAGYSVHFEQVKDGLAINKIWDANPTIIMGKLTATGQVVLENTNGVIFSPTARVETQRFVATALSAAADFGQSNRDPQSPAFENPQDNAAGFISVERGAEIKALAGGRVMMIGPRVFNEGRIETPSGQTILAAGQKVYLFNSYDPAQRGLLVAVDAFQQAPDAQALPEGVNTVEQAEARKYQTVNGATVEGVVPPGTPGVGEKINAVVAEKGSINLVGMTIRQNGVLTATTAVKGQNGAIYLHASKTAQAASTYVFNSDSAAPKPMVAGELGSVEFGSESVTSVTPSTATAETQKDGESYYRSRIDVLGNDVRVASGAQLVANAGNIAIGAVAQRTSASGLESWVTAQDLKLSDVQGANNAPDGSRLVIESGAKIDVSGLRDVMLPMSRNQLSGYFFKNELADAPLQRSGVLYRTEDGELRLDARKSTKVANVKGFYSGIERTAEEISTRGGNVLIQGQGSVVVAEGAQVDISGGNVTYEDGRLSSSLVRKGDRLLPIEDAQAGEHYDQVIVNTAGRRVQSYKEGADAGTAQVTGLGKTYVGLTGFKADAVVGPHQHTGEFSDGYDEREAGVEGARRLSARLGRASILADRPEKYATLQPKSGLITIGQSYETTSSRQLPIMSRIDLVSKLANPVSAVPGFGDQGFQAFLDNLPDVAQIDAGNLQHSGTGRVELAAGTVTMDRDARLDLGSYGALSIVGWNRVSLGGFIKAEGGEVRVTVVGKDVTNAAIGVGDFELQDSATIDLSGGLWSEARNGLLPLDLSIAGGKFDVDVSRSITLAQGSLVDVSAGATQKARGSVSKGQAGSVSLALNVEATAVADGQIELGGTLRGYDFSKGGSLTLKGMRTLTIGQEAQAVDGGLALAPDFLSSGGFGNIKLSALGDVTVLDGTRLAPALSNFVAPSSAQGGAGVAEIQVLPLADREAVSLTLEATLPPVVDDVYLPRLRSGGSITIGKGALIDVGAGGKLSLMAGRKITVMDAASTGGLVAHGGEIAMSIDVANRGNAAALGQASSNQIGYIEDQEIRLQTGAVIDVSGTAKTAMVAGRTTGKVLGGGAVNLNYTQSDGSVRGRVVTETGSTIKLNGASAELSLTRGRTLTRVSKGAGSLNIASSDSFLLAGSIEAKRPDDSVGGGQFYASLSLAGANDLVSLGAAYPSDDPLTPTRRIVVEADQQAVSDKANATGGKGAFAEGAVSAQQLFTSGFDSIHLRADDAIELKPGVHLKAPDKAPLLRSIILNTRTLQADSVSTDPQNVLNKHEIQAHYVSLGNRDLRARYQDSGMANAPRPSASSGGANVQVTAGLIEAYGHSSFTNTGSLSLLATMDRYGRLDQRTDGEVRFVGRTWETGSALTGSLNFDGGLTLQAGQVYATTLSSFDLSGPQTRAEDDPGKSSLTVLRPHLGSTSQAPLSALAQLTLKADDVMIDGVVRQPFGSIVIEGKTEPRLTANSVLSVTGDGLTVPVGTTVNERQWVYATQGTEGDLDLSNAGSGIQKLDLSKIDKGVTVTGYGLSIDASSQLQAQAGGDLLAWEFQPGVGGSTDTLSRKNVFAILPNYQYDFAPYDTEIAASTRGVGTQLNAGDQVTITTRSGVLPKGTYTLLPARYAILPGAVLVSETEVDGSKTLRRAGKQDDGSIIVSGYRTGTGTSINGGGDPRLALLLEPLATFDTKSTIVRTSINQFLADQARQQGQALPSRPGDGGHVSLHATGKAFDWAAKYSLGGKQGFSGGQFDLAMPRMAVVSDPAKTPAGYAAVTAQALVGTGAESILLGGTRHGVEITPYADDIKVMTNLGRGEGTVGEWAIVGRKTVSLDNGVQVVAQGSSDHANDLVLKGEGASVVVSNRAATTLSRTASPSETQGELALGKGVSLIGASVQLDARDAVTGGLDSLNVVSSGIGIGANRLSIGGDTSDNTDVEVAGALINGKERVQLRAYERLDLVGSVRIGAFAADGKPLVQQMIIDAPLVRGVASAAGAVAEVAELAAQQIVFQNLSAPESKAQAVGGSTAVKVTASPFVKDTTAEGITLGKGNQALAFTKVDLKTSGDVVLREASTRSTQGDLAITAARLTGDSTADQSIESRGVLTMAKAENARSLNDRIGAGAKVSLTGSRVEQKGVIDLSSGQLNITGTGAGTQSKDTVVFAKDSKTLLQGFLADGGRTWSQTAPGGHLKAEAKQGNIVLDGLVDVSAPMPTNAADPGAAAGSVFFKAAQGELNLGAHAQLKGTSAQPSTSGVVKVDVAKIVSAPIESQAQPRGTLDRLAKLLADGDFKREIDIRVREGEQSLYTTLTAARAIISADKGLTLGGGAVIDARATRGGVVQLSAGDDLVLASGARIDASSSASPEIGANGGDVLLSSKDGDVRLEGGVGIDASGDDAQDGRVVIRAKRADRAAGEADVINVDLDAGSVSAIKSGEIVVEAVRTYEGTSLSTARDAGNPESIGQDQLKTDIEAFAAKKDLNLKALNLDDSPVHLRAGIELQSKSGGFTVNNDWNLQSTTHAGGEPIMLTIRAQGDVNVKGSISDGFETVAPVATNKQGKTSGPTKIMDGAAASIRIVAGADFDAPNVTAARTGLASDAPGSIKLDAGKLIRTTGGSIDLDAGNHLQLGENAAVYVTGKTSPSPTGSTTTTTNVWRQFTNHGGRVDVNVGGSIQSAQATQLFGNWFYHSGGASPKDVAWWTSFGSFKQGLGSMGGGNVRVTAGGDIENLGVAAPTSARTVSRSGALSQVVENGGDVLVRADGNVSGGAFMLGRGEGRVESQGGTLGSNREWTNENNVDVKENVGLILGLMDGQWSVHARDDIKLSAVYNPTAVAAFSQKIAGSSLVARLSEADVGSYFTYGDKSSLSLSSLGGSVTWSDQLIADLGTLFKSLHNVLSPSEEKLSFGVTQTTVNVLPPSLTIAAFSGDVSLASSVDAPLLLFPSSTGNLTILAGNDLRLESGATIVMGDSDVSSWKSGTTKQPAKKTTEIAEIKTAGLHQANGTDFTPANKLLGLLHQGDEEPARIHAGRDIELQDDSRLYGFEIPKQADISAGRDIISLAYSGQNLRATDVTLIRAGRNFVGPDKTGLGLIQLGGPGELQIEAGRNIDLNVSSAVQTVGQLVNPLLPEEGAHIRLTAGADRRVDIEAFAKTYLNTAPARQALIDFVQQTLGLSGLAFDEALQQYRGFTTANQLKFAEGKVLSPLFIQRYILSGDPSHPAPYEAAWMAFAKAFGARADDFESKAFDRFKHEVVTKEVARLGDLAADIALTNDDKENAKREKQRRMIWDQLADFMSVAGMGLGIQYQGDIDMAASTVNTRGKGGEDFGGIDLFAPGGKITVGFNKLTPNEQNALLTNDASEGLKHGLVTYDGGAINAVSDGDFQVNVQRAMVVGDEDLTIYSANRDIDSGRGSNTNVIVPSKVARLNAKTGIVEFVSPPVTVGNGIQIVNDHEKGTIRLLTPNGEVKALDAFIKGARINIPGPVRGGNLTLKGTVSGQAPTPVVSVNLGINSGLGTEAAGSQLAADELRQSAKARERGSLLTVELLGLGEAEPTATGQPSAVTPNTGDAKKPQDKDESASDCDRVRNCKH